MELARAPQAQKTELTHAQEVILRAIADGQTPSSVARKLAKGDARKAQVWRQRIRRWMLQQAEFRDGVAMNGKAEAMLWTGPAIQALGRRAMRGRVDAIRLLFEVSGFHNPKVDHRHEHSGQIDIRLTMGGRPEPVVDADVVED